MAVTQEQLLKEERTWLVTALATIGATLTGALLLWIAGNQVSITTSQAVLSTQFKAQTRAFEQYSQENKKNDMELRDWLEQIWPRLRVHGENIEVIKRHLELICDCEVELNDPERF